MMIPRYWARAEADGLTAWGWSEQSVDEALTMARARVQRMSERFANQEHLERYPYGSVDAIRELCVERFSDAQGQTAAAVTRNAYGALVLNARDLMMADIDFPVPRRSMWDRLRNKPVPAVEEFIALALSDLEKLVQAHPGMNVRVYRTRAGLRYLFTDQPRIAGTPETTSWLESVGTDPLYVRLCRSQKCFRARLTPKPWRCGVRPERLSYPFVNEAAQARFQTWLSRYERASQAYATCQLLQQIGSGVIAAELEPWVGLHDATSRCTAALPLA